MTWAKVLCEATFREMLVHLYAIIIREMRKSFMLPEDGRNISRKVASLKTFAHGIWTHYIIKFLPWNNGKIYSKFLDVLQTRCLWKFCKIHIKTPMLDSLIKNDSSIGIFRWILWKLALFLQNASVLMLLWCEQIF